MKVLKCEQMLEAGMHELEFSTFNGNVRSVIILAVCSVWREKCMARGPDVGMVKGHKMS